MEPVPPWTQLPFIAVALTMQLPPALRHCACSMDLALRQLFMLYTCTVVLRKILPVHPGLPRFEEFACRQMLQSAATEEELEELKALEESELETALEDKMADESREEDDSETEDCDDEGR